MGDPDILESKHLKGLSAEERLELATRALCQAAREAGAIADQLRSIAATFEHLLKSMARILSEEDRARYEKALLEAMNGPSK